MARSLADRTFQLRQRRRARLAVAVRAEPTGPRRCAGRACDGAAKRDAADSPGALARLRTRMNNVAGL